MEKQTWEIQKRKEEKRRSERRKSQKKENAGPWKGRKAAKHRVFFPMFCGSGGSKVGSLKRRVRRWERKNCTPWWREPHSEVKTCKAPQFWSTFASEALCMIWPHFFVAGASKTRWYEAISSALNWPFSKEVAQNCFVFDVVNFSKIEEVSQKFVVLGLSTSILWRTLADLLRCGHASLHFWRKPRGLADGWIER